MWARRLLPLVLLSGLIIGGLNTWERHEVLAPGPLARPTAFVVPRGGTARVAAALADAGIIGSPLLFRLAAFQTRREGPLRAAELAFPAHVSLRDTLTILRVAPPVEHRLTIPEGATATQIKMILDGADAAVGDTPPIQEGALLPQTYFYERGVTRADLASRAARAMRQRLDMLWSARDPGLPLATPTDTLVLASIVERETAGREEREHVASVYINRLRAGMKLQADPTVSYAAGTPDRPPTRADLDLPSPYNTYKVAGLPPGPICAPGEGSLRAALHPRASDDLYFVADGTGGHVFAATLADHNRNVASWRARVVQ